MDKLVNSQLDKVDSLEDGINAIIEQEIAKIKIDEVMANPTDALAEVAERVKLIFLDDYANKAVELGMEFGKAINKKIEQDKTIKVDMSGDPKANVESES